MWTYVNKWQMDTCDGSWIGSQYMNKTQITDLFGYI